MEAGKQGHLAFFMILARVLQYDRLLISAEKEPGLGSGVRRREKRQTYTQTERHHYCMKRKTLSFILTGTFLAAAGTVSAQMAPPPQQQGGQEGRAAPHEQRQIQPQAPQQQEARPAQDPAAMQAKLEEMHGKLEEISHRLHDIHQEALLQENVRQYLIDYETVLNEKIDGNAPGLEEQVEAHARVLGEIKNVGGDADELSETEKRELERLLEEHAQVKQQLAPIEGQLMHDPEMQEARGEYQENLISAMHEVDSDVNDIIRERMEIAQNFMALQQEFLQSQQSQGGQPAPGQQQGQQPRGAHPAR